MIVTEGLVSVEVPDTIKRKGPGKAEPGFYNSAQKLNRDVSVIFLNWAKPKFALDGFGGTGIRGIRYSIETDTTTVIAERNKIACEIIEKNIQRNKTDTALLKDPYESVLSKNLFDFIDIDPYGSTLQYIDQAVSAVRDGGYIAITATDQSVLTGSVARKTMLRYGATVQNDIFRHEEGVRLLIGTFARKAAALEREAIPILSLWYSHYYRVIFRIKSGIHRALDSLGNIGFLNKHDLISKYYPNVIEGPLWLGKLFSESFLNGMEIPEYMADDRVLQKYVDLFKNEDLSLLFCDLSEIARIRKDSPIPLKKITSILLEHKLTPFGRTQFSPTGIKVNATMDQLMSLIYTEK